MSTERLADRTNLGPDHRHPDDVPLPGTEDLTPLDDPPHTHATDWCAHHGPRPCTCAQDGEPEPVDLDRPMERLTPNTRYL